MACYNFKLVEEKIVGDMVETNNEVKFTIFNNDVLTTNDKVVYGEAIYSVHSVTDVTTDNEFSDGFSFVEILLLKI